MKINSTARVVVTLEVDTGSSWGADCTVAQIHKQAAEETVAHILRELNNARVRVVGTPIVKVVTSEESR